MMGLLLIAVGAVTFVGGKRVPFALNAHKTLGQSFTAKERFNVLWVVAPSWNDNEGGFTLRLWDSPQKRKLFAERQFINFPDNATLCLYLPHPLPPGRYYWEISDRVGKTKVGLYGAVGSKYEGGCAYFDGRPNPDVDFLSGHFFTPLIREGRRLSLASRRKLERGEPLLPPGSPKWIWFPEPVPASWKARFFRRKFSLPAAPERATIEITGDDSYTLFVNGREVGRGGQPIVDEFDLTNLLRKGENVLAVSVRNAVPPAGLIARLEVKLPGGRKLKIVTDGKWLSSTEAPEGWTKVDFDDSRWRRARVVGEVTSGPWFGQGNVWRLAGIKVPAGLLERLSREPPLRAEVRKEKGAPRLFVNGRPVLPLLFWSADLPEFSQDWPLMGGHLYLLLYDLRSGWRPEGFDFRSLLYQALLVLARDPQALFLVRVHLHPPPWWEERHKSELIRYADTAPPSDSFGSTVEPSVASEAFRRDAGEALGALVRFLERGPLKSRILGYHIAYGIYGEWHYIGSRYLPDVSQPMARAFREWARRRYGTPEALRTAWGGLFPKFEDIRPPTKEERLKSAFSLLRDPARGPDRFVADFYRFLHEENADCLLHFARIVKRESEGRKLCGAFYTYLLENLWIQEGGHLAPERVLNSRDIDFLSCPYTYQGDAYDGAGNFLGRGRGFGGDGAYRVLAESLKLHGKLYLAEVDTCTYLEPDPSKWGFGRPEGVWESLMSIRRDFANMLGNAAGGWLFDLGPGWFADGPIVKEVRRLRKIGDLSLDRDLSPVAQISAVYDPKSFFYTQHWRHGRKYGAGEYDLFDFYFLDAQNRALHRIGAPLDQIYLFDLERARDYKLYIFVNTFALTDGEVEAIRRKACRGGAVVVWLYGPGLVHPERGVSVERAERLVGMRLRMRARPSPMRIALTERGKALFPGAPKAFGVPGDDHAPLLWVDDPGAEVLGVWEGTNLPAFAVKRLPGWTSVFIGTAPVPAPILRGLAERAGVRMWSSRPDIVYANRSLFSLVAQGDGERRLGPPRPARDALTGEEVHPGQKVRMRHGEVRIFVLSKS